MYHIVKIQNLIYVTFASKILWRKIRNPYEAHVTRVKRRDDKMIKVDIKWEESFIACGEIYLTEEILKKHSWNPETPKKYAWRQNVRRYLTTIE